MNYYLDASAWVKRYIREEGSGWMNQFFGRTPLAAASSTLGLIEVLASVSRRPRPHATATDALAAAFAAVRRDFAGMMPIPLAEPVVHLAGNLAERHRLRGADCIHLASALHLHEQSGEPLTLVACDRELLAAATIEGLAIINPTDQMPDVLP